MTKLQSDTPIENESGDRLGYSAFATSLARSIIDIDPAEGFVLGVQAAWGMGKTSAINITREAIRQTCLETESQSKIIVKDFNPWLFSGLEALVRGYLAEIGRLVAETVDQDTSFTTRRTLEKLIKGGAELLGGAAALGAIALSGGSALPYANTIKAGVTGTANLGSFMLDNRSLDSMIEDLRIHLRETNTKILVVIDDLDRLQPDEIRQILTLIKTFGNLPGLIHLLVYDRKIIDAALAVQFSDRPTFREKIVQAEFDLPPPDADGLRAMVFDKLIAVVGENPPMEARDWWEVTQVAFSFYLKSPRDVVRLTNAFAVSWQNIKGEAYLPDFMSIELFRHFDRELYESIRQNKDFLVGTAGFLSDEETESIVNRIRETVDARRRNAIFRLMSLLFPANGSKLHERFEISHPTPPPFSGRRICDPAGFDTFFRFAAPVGEISIAEFEDIAKSINNPKFLKDKISSALSRRRSDGTSLAGRLLNGIIEIVKSQNVAPENILSILLQQGDDLVVAKDEARDFFRIDNRHRLARIFELLVPLIAESERADQLIDCLQSQNSSLVMSCQLAAYLCEPFDLIWKTESGRRTAPLISRDDAMRIGKVVACRVRESSQAKQIDLREGISLILKVWAAFEGFDGPAKFVNNLMDDPESLLAIAFSNMSIVTSLSGAYREITRPLETGIYDMQRMAEKLDEYLKQGRLKPSDEKDAQTFVRQAATLMSGSEQEGGD